MKKIKRIKKKQKGMNNILIIKVMIRTPKGHATENEQRLRKFIIGVKRARVKVINNYVDDDDSQFVWEIEGPVRDILRISKNVSRFDIVMKGVLDNRLVKRTIRKQLSADGEAELKTLLAGQTSVEIIKEAEAQEMVDDTRTWWQRMTQTFKRV